MTATPEGQEALTRVSIAAGWMRVTETGTFSFSSSMRIESVNPFTACLLAV